jgi:hypothetical protein
MTLSRHGGEQTKEITMSNVTKFALSAAISQHRFFGAGGKQAWSYQGAGS